MAKYYFSVCVCVCVLVICCLFDNSLSDRCGMVPHCGFDLQIPVD